MTFSYLDSFLKKNRSVHLLSSGIIAFVSVLLLLLVSCGRAPEGNQEKGTLILSVDSPFQTRTLLPDIDMVPADFAFSGIGPSGSNFSVQAEHNPVEVPMLVCGEWTVTVNARNAGGIVVAQGKQTVTLQAGTTQTVTIIVAPVEGYGTVDLAVHWTAEDVSSPTIEAQLISNEGAPIDLEFGIAEAGTAVCVKDMVPTGYHTLVVQLLDNGALAMGAVEIVRVVNEQITSGVYEFYEINQDDNNINILITPVLCDPIVVGLAGKKAEISLGGSMTVTASVPAGAGSVVYVWYINGESKATGASYTCGGGLPIGVYRLDVTAFTADGNRAGSATCTFQIVETVTPQNIINAETGDVSQWDLITTSNGNAFTADKNAALHGTYGFKAALSGIERDYCYGKKFVSNQYNDISLKFNVYLPSNYYPMHNQSTNRYWVLANVEDDSTGDELASLEMSGSSTQLLVHQLVYASNTVQWNLLKIDEPLALDTWHSFEIRCRVGGVGTALVQLLIDGVVKTTASGFANNNYDMESVIAGCLWNTKYTANGEYLYFDDIQIDSTIY